MTPEQLKQARAKEAVRLVYAMEKPGFVAREDFGHAVSLETQRLIDTDWRPPEPINPDLIEARECCAMVAEGLLGRETAGGYRYGDYDASLSVQSTLLAIERGRWGCE